MSYKYKIYPLPKLVLSITVINNYESGIDVGNINSFINDIYCIKKMLNICKAFNLISIILAQ